MVYGVMNNYCCRDVANCVLTGWFVMAISDKQEVVDPVQHNNMSSLNLAVTNL